jgi:hypothetical protein
MLGNRKLIIDTFSDVYNELKSWANDEFWDFSTVDIIPGAIYIVGRNQLNNNTEKIKQIAENNLAKIIISIPGEGSETLVTLCLVRGLKELIKNNKILLISGGDMESTWPHIQYDYFLPKVFDFDENILASQSIDEIFNTDNKPYKFLFLNGRTRPHRKYLLERFNLTGLLDSALWTNLDSGLQLVKQLNSGHLYTNNDVEKINIQLMHDGQDIMFRPKEIHFLPREYEVDRYQDRLALPIPNNQLFLDDHLFNNEWGEIYVNPKPYVDTYFSVVTETVFNYPYSFRTEKIWKPVAMGHPWIAVANCGYYRDIKNLGFQTFGHIIDESFDSIENSQDRIERIAVVVEDLCQQDLAKFIKECYNICKYNQQHLIELRTKIQQEFPNRFFQFINTHLNE